MNQIMSWYKMLKIRLFLLAFLSVALLSGCASTSNEDERLSVEQLYNRGHELLEQTKYKKAAETFEQVELEYPYSRWATESKLMSAYAYYKDEKYDEAVMALERFIRFHPGNENIAYAYYLKAISYFDQISDVNRDQGETAKALDAMNQLVMRFPMTKYAEDVKQKIIYATENLAGQEMEVGRYYLKKHNYLSALNRFSNVVTKYQTTNYIEEALYRQVEIYIILGLNQEASTSYQVLKYNYPESKWTNKASKIIKG